jgi:hypothetical protein
MSVIHPASRVAVVEQPATMNPITSRPMVMTDKRFIVISSYAALMTSELLPSFWIPHRAAMANLGATKKSALAPDLPCLLGNNSRCDIALSMSGVLAVFTHSISSPFLPSET